MKLVLFNEFRVGVLRGTDVVDVTDVVTDIPHRNPADLMIGLIERFADYRPKLEQAVAKGKGVPVDSVKLRAPLPRPGKIDCMALNYIEEGTQPEPAPKNGFQKSPTAIIGPGDTMVLPDVPATIFEGEAEIGVVIGKRGSNIDAKDAMSHIFGYVNFIDGSARGLHPMGNTFFQMKARDTFCPIGPYIVTADEVPDPQKLQIRQWINGELKQNFNSADMAHKLPEVIAWMSSIHVLEPGDLIGSGTHHHGLTSYQDGDKIEMEVEGLGRLQFYVRDDLKRTWSRDTRIEHLKKGLQGQTPQLTGKYAPAK